MSNPTSQTAVARAAEAAQSTAARATQAGITRLPPEIRLMIFSHLIPQRTVVDTLMVPRNRDQLCSVGYPAGDEDDADERAETERKITERLDSWDPRNLFLVCRLFHAEAAYEYYSRNTFDFYTPKQCLRWLDVIGPRNAGYLRTLSLPVDHLPSRFDGRTMMEALPHLAAGVTTLYLTRTVLDKPPSYGRGWDAYGAAGLRPDRGEGYTDLFGWASAHINAEPSATPPGGPFRRITAASASPSAAGADDDDDEVLDSMELIDTEYIMVSMGRLPHLATVYLHGSAFSRPFDRLFGKVLAELEQTRQEKEESGLESPGC